MGKTFGVAYLIMEFNAHLLDFIEKQKHILSALLMLLCAIPASARDGALVKEWTGLDDDLYLYHEHTKGNGVPVFIMPVHFDNNDLVEGGALQRASTWAAELIIQSELLEGGLADYFDIYIYLDADSVSPVPPTGYVDRFWEKYEKSKYLYMQRIGGSDLNKMHFIYLGNGPVGGHAYGGAGTYLSWYAEQGDAQQENDYWTTHEFLGHTFTRLADEYETAVGNAPNMVISETRPNENDVPWADFFGFEAEGETTVGLYTFENPDYHGWRPYEYSFMSGGYPWYVPMYHKWLTYQKVMEYAGYYKTIFDFCEFKGIKLPKLEGRIPTKEEQFYQVLSDGGTYQLDKDMTGDEALNKTFIVQNNLTIDLNGHAVTFKNGIRIANGNTLTIIDSAPGTNEMRVYGGPQLTAIDVTGGQLIINSGRLTALAADTDGNVLEGAGIGVTKSVAGGHVTINGGIVNAIGGYWCAGIGGTIDCYGCHVTITGGVVNACRNDVNWGDACDIGQGSSGKPGVTTITGGSVMAKNSSVDGISTQRYPVCVIVKDTNGNRIDQAEVSVGTYVATTGDNLTNDFTPGLTEPGVAWLWLEEGETEINAQREKLYGETSINVRRQTEVQTVTITVNDKHSGIQTIEASQKPVRIYFASAGSELHIEGENLTAGTPVYVYRLDGSLAISESCDTNNTIINVSQLPSGYYAISVGKHTSTLLKP